MLLQNANFYAQYPFRLVGGGPGVSMRANWSKTNRLNIHDRLGDFTALPHGHAIGSAWLPPRNVGGLSTYRDALITFTGNTSNAAQGLNAEGTTTVTFTSTATGAAIAAAEGTTTITFTTSGLATAPINGTGTASITITGNSSVIEGIASILGESSFSITGNALSTYAIGHMVATPIDTSLTQANVGEAVWSTIVESGLSAEEIMRIILSVQVGKTDVSGSTVTFRDVDDTKNRVTATMTGSERTTIVLDGE